MANAKMLLMILQMVFLVLHRQAEAIKIKREPYSVQEMGQDFSSGEDISSFSGGPWSGGFSSGSGGSIGQFIKGGASFGGLGSGQGGLSSGQHGQLYSTQIGIGSGGGLGGFMHDSPIQPFASVGSVGSIGSVGSFGKGISEGSHLISGGNSQLELTDEAQSKIKNLILESKLKFKLAAEKIESMRKNFGYGTFGYKGYEYPFKTGPIDLGTHHAIDLGTSLDSNSIKDAHGKLKLPVQTVYITKTVGVPIPEPFPVKHEVAVPAPYPVPVPSHYSSEGSSYGSYPSSFSTDYSSDSGKSSYQSSDSSLSKVVTYHENLPKSTEKHYASASTTYARYLPSQSSSSYRTLTPTHYSPKQSVYEF